MAYSNSVIGTEQVLANIRNRSARAAAGCERGVRIAGLALQRASQSIVPVETGRLQASAFTHITGTGFTTVATVGYSAFYAPYVHELVQMKLRGQDRRPSPPHHGKYWDPQGQGQAKFLEAPTRTFQSTFNKIVADEMRRSIWFLDVLGL